MNALTKAAYKNINRETSNNNNNETVSNYIIAIVCGIALGVMFGLGV